MEITKEVTNFIFKRKVMEFDADIQIGVLGGGQLGRMMIQSALDFNLDIHVLDPDASAPCSAIAHTFTQGSLTDFDTVMQFGADKDLITIEIENVNTAALKALQAAGKKVFPQPEIIELIQNKHKQKLFYQAHDIPTATFYEIKNLQDLKAREHLLPFVQKLATGGYDGRGVQSMKSAEDFSKGFDAPSFIESFVPFEKELAVIVARSAGGEVRTFPVVEMAFHPEKNLVEYLFSPAQVDEATERKAQELAKQVINSLDMVGLLAVEMFLTSTGEILVNEVAPRTHNSGHQTIEGNITSQFEQHLRAILNWPLGSTDTLVPAAMVNVLGEEGFTGTARYEGMDKVLSLTGVHPHLYGKKITKPFRKMGHVTITGHDLVELKEKVNFVQKHLKVKA